MTQRAEICMLALVFFMVPGVARQETASGRASCVTERNVMIPMRDGARLAIDLYLPVRDGIRLEVTFPAISERPQGRTPDPAGHLEQEFPSLRREP